MGIFPAIYHEIYKKVIFVHTVTSSGKEKKRVSQFHLIVNFYKFNNNLKRPLGISKTCYKLDNLSVKLS